MGIEIEKKYCLTKEQQERLRRRLREIEATKVSEEFEENTLFNGGSLDQGNCVLRLRRVGDSAILTYKERLPSSPSIKHQREEETRVDDPEAMEDILGALGFAPILVYEKRRATWRLGDAEIAVDELPFGLFMEIEADENEIMRIERLLGLKGLRAEMETYPRLTLKHGRKTDGIVEARFRRNRSPKPTTR
jgi:adenylate cyclase class 2